MSNTETNNKKEKAVSTTLENKGSREPIKKKPYTTNNFQEGSFDFIEETDGTDSIKEQLNNLRKTHIIRILFVNVVAVGKSTKTQVTINKRLKG